MCNNKTVQAQKTLLTITGFILFLTLCCTDSIKVKEPVKASDTINHGYNELANTDKRETFTISDYNTDNPEVENIQRPAKSLLSTTIDTALLFGIWTNDPNGPHADFQFSSKSFYVVDYDGDGNRPGGQWI
jgi:hypothetical protein